MYKVRLSPYANLFYIEWLLNPYSVRYNISVDQLLYGQLDVDRLKSALKRYVSEHLVLNSHVAVSNETPYWVENDGIKLLEYCDNAFSRQDLLDYVRQHFDLYQGPLYRFKVWRVSDEVYRLILVFHHIVIDGLRLEEGIFGLLSRYYNDNHYTERYTIDDQSQKLSHIASLFTTQLHQYQGDHKAFWRAQLNGLESVDMSFLTVGNATNNTILYDTHNPVKEILFQYSETTLRQLKYISRHYSITPYRYGLSVLALLLHKYTGQSAFAISYPVAIREALDFIYGAQLNTNVVGYRFTSIKTIKDLLDQTRQFFRAVKPRDKRYGYYPIANILQTFDRGLLTVSFAQTHLRRQSIFDFKGISKVLPLSELNMDSVEPGALLFEQDLNRLIYRVRYYQHSFNETLLQGFVEHYQKLFVTLLNDLAKNTIKAIGSYPLLETRDYANPIYDFNKPLKVFSNQKTLHQWFEAQVEKTPTHIAVKSLEQELSYQALNIWANQLAHYLKSHYTIQPNDLIALSLDKNACLIVAILAVLKAGGAYVPLAPNYPEARIATILSETNTKVIITQQCYWDKFAAHNSKHSVCIIDSSVLHAALQTMPTHNLQRPVSSDHLAYLLYTSGTTGKPKGVLQPHKNVVSLFLATQDLYHFNSRDVWTLFHAYVFDFAVWEIWGALLYGGKLVIPTVEQIMDSQLFYKLCCQEKVTVLNQTPRAFYTFLKVAVDEFKQNGLSDLRYVIFGGERLDIRRLIPWFHYYGDKKPQLVNMYGITETTVHTTYKILKSNDDWGKQSIIGKSLPDQKVYILDRTKQPLPIGAVGELYVGGAGLAYGYFNQEDLTCERFIPNPFQTDAEKTHHQNQRLYKTGDRVRLLPDGEMEYLGRYDCQVKVRGYRIELKEIEVALMHYSGIQEAVVIQRTDINVKDDYPLNDNDLIAYYVSETQLNESAIRDDLLHQLPEYMVPGFLVALKSIPLTVNGKIDIKALPAPTLSHRKLYIAPRNEQEYLICQSFEQVLELTNSVSIKEDFFRLGGDSLKAIQLTFALQSYFSIKVSDIFDLRTPQKLAENLIFEGGNVLEKTLAKVSTFYKTQSNLTLLANSSVMDKKKAYLKSVANLSVDCTLKQNITSVLLTGATGFLGCNLLDQLLINTEYTVFLLIRAKTQQQAIDRICHKYRYYFDQSLELWINKRVFVIKSDIEQAYLGLSQSVYQILSAKVDSIIHAAALVKHYGDKAQFDSVNVQATVNLLKLAKVARQSYFHYISTSSIFMEACINDQPNIYTEDDSVLLTSTSRHIYLKTKIQAEHEVMKYRDQGIKGTIYRVGNLAFILKNGRVQENINDNAFSNWVQFLLESPCIAKEISQVEMSPADLTAQAVIKLFDSADLKQAVYHVFNPNYVDLIGMFSKLGICDKNIVSMDDFVSYILSYLSKDHKGVLMLKFLLRQGWLDGRNDLSLIYNDVLQDRTEKLLKMFDFKWPVISQDVLSNYFNAICPLDTLVM